MLYEGLLCLVVYVVSPCGAALHGDRCGIVSEWGHHRHLVYCMRCNGEGLKMSL